MSTTATETVEPPITNGSADTGAGTGISQDGLEIPIIPFSPFLHGTPSQRLSTAHSILHAFRTSGFLYLSDHPIPASTISTVFSHSAAFFSRPQSQKDALAWLTPQSNRGYVAFGREQLSLTSDNDEGVARLRAQNPDLKESMEIGREGVEGLPNQLPDRFGDAEGLEFTRVVREFFDTCKELHRQVMRAIAVGMMGLEDEGFFNGYTDAGDNNLRLLHYPPVEKRVFREKSEGRKVRAGEHSDYGSITLLFQDEVGGLEVRSPKGTFVRATPVPGTIVVNAGDLLARWSNDTIKSTRHRVVQPPDRGEEAGGDGEAEDAMYGARYSVAYFCNPNFDRWIEALPGTWEDSGGKKYPGIRSGDYLVQRLTATY
ncbi:MAG: hypothetical protein Q9160_007176 [Pyrenula sp. 1 TL-2023]